MTLEGSELLEDSEDLEYSELSENSEFSKKSSPYPLTPNLSPLIPQP